MTLKTAHLRRSERLFNLVSWTAAKDMPFSKEQELLCGSRKEIGVGRILGADCTTVAVFVAAKHFPNSLDSRGDNFFRIKFRVRQEVQLP